MSKMNNFSRTEADFFCFLRKRHIDIINKSKLYKFSLRKTKRQGVRLNLLSIGGSAPLLWTMMMMMEMRIRHQSY